MNTILGVITALIITGIVLTSIYLLSKKKKVVTTNPQVRVTNDYIQSGLWQLSMAVIFLFVLVWFVYTLGDNNKDICKTHSFRESYELKNNQVKKIYIPSGYKLETDGRGDKYYYQTESIQKTLVGGGEPPLVNKNYYEKYVYLSVYKKEIIVDCTFTPR